MWKPATFHGTDLQFLLIDNENVIMIPEPRQKAIHFWETLGLPDTPSSLPVVEHTSSGEHVLNSPITPQQSLTMQTPPVAVAAPSENNYAVAYVNNVPQSFPMYIHSLNGI